MMSKKQITIAISNTDIDRENLPTKEDFLKNPEKREEFASKALSFKSEIKDSDAFWTKKNEILSAFRYLDAPLLYRDMIPMKLSMFQTRATTYNHDPWIHRLYENYELMKERPAQDFLTWRLSKVLENSATVQWAHSLKAELHSTVLAPVVQGTTIYWQRHEWGANANPHTYSLSVIGKLSKNSVIGKRRLSNSMS